MNRPEFPRVALCGQCGGVGHIWAACGPCARLAEENGTVTHCSSVMAVCPTCDSYGYVVPKEWVQSEA